MKHRFSWSYAPILALVSFAAVSAEDVGKVQPGDWPQWQGPNRDAICKETGLLQSWPKGGPKLVWTAKNLGGSYGSPTIAAGRIFGMGNHGNDEGIWAIKESDGSDLWFTRIAAKGKALSNGDFPRCSPTVDGNLVYGLGMSGDLVCLEVATGKVKWKKNLKADFGGVGGKWAYSESPLIDGEKLLVSPGGAKATILALNKLTGATIWECPIGNGEPAQYASMIAVMVDGKRQYIQFMGALVGLSEKGELLWQYDKFKNKTANCSSPVFHDGYVFAASSYNNGGGLVKLKNEGGKYVAEEVYFNPKLLNHHGGMVLIGDYLYGDAGGKMTCWEFKTGTIKWAEPKAGKGSILFADKRLYYRDEKGPIHLVEANPEKYVEHGVFSQPEASGQKTWSHPVVSNGKLYIRDQDMLYCYDVKSK